MASFRSSSFTFAWGLFLVLAVCVIVRVQSQVNFSPAWGKRGQVQPLLMARGGLGDVSSSQPGDCKLSFDKVLRVLNLIQGETQRLLRCEQSLMGASGPGSNDPE